MTAGFNRFAEVAEFSRMTICRGCHGLVFGVG